MDKWKFTSYERDTDTNLDYARMRFNSGRLARFMSPDPYSGSIDSGNPQSWNRYAYVMNDPLNMIDALGLCGQTWDGKNTVNFDFTGCGDDSFAPILMVDPSARAMPMQSTGQWFVHLRLEVPKVLPAANNGTPQQPQQPKSPARQQCEANAANKYQNTFNAVDNSFYYDAYKSGLKGVLWGGLVGCALTSEIGCAEGGLPLAVIGGLAGAGKSMWENLGSVGMAYLQYRDEMNACKAIP